MKKLSILFILAAASLLPWSAVQANPPTNGSFTAGGSFRYNDGTTTSAGTYVETRLAAGATVTDTIVYTLTGSGATSTDTVATTLNTDDSKTVVASHTAFGATAAFTATVTFPAYTTTKASRRGTITITSAGPFGTGTFTAADGTTGTLTTVVTDGVVATDLNNATTGLTRELREEGEGGEASVKTYTVSPAGALTITTLTRRGSHGHH